MPSNFIECKDCGLLIAREPGRERCLDCQRVYEARLETVQDAVDRLGNCTIEDLSRETGIDPHEIERVVKSSDSVAPNVVFDELCHRCRTEKPQPGSEFCFDCRMELNKELGKVKGDLADKVRSEEYKPNYPAKATGVYSSVAEKRSRTAASHINPSPKFRKY